MAVGAARSPAVRLAAVPKDPAVPVRAPAIGTVLAAIPVPPSGAAVTAARPSSVAGVTRPARASAATATGATRPARVSAAIAVRQASVATAVDATESGVAAAAALPAAPSRARHRQRTEFRSSITRLGVSPLRDVAFGLAVGTAIPRSVSLHRLPPAIVEIVPEYEGYDFILVRDDIVIVDPDTYEIVDVIPA